MRAQAYAQAKDANTEWDTIPILNVRHKNQYNEMIFLQDRYNNSKRGMSLGIIGIFIIQFIQQFCLFKCTCMLLSGCVQCSR